MTSITKEITKKLIMQIRDIALQGQADTVWYEGRSDKYMYDAGEDIYWQASGQYLLVYIESFGKDSYSYRLYRCSGEARYDRRTVMNPALESEDCRCLFSFREDRENKYLLYFHKDEAWYEAFEKDIGDFINDNCT